MEIRKAVAGNPQLFCSMGNFRLSNKSMRSGHFDKKKWRKILCRRISQARFLQKKIIKERFKHPKTFGEQQKGGTERVKNKGEKPGEQGKKKQGENTKETSKIQERKVIFGDEYLFFEGKDGHPKYENIDEKWTEIIEWLETVRERNLEKEGFENSQPDVIGQELVRWAKKKDMYPIFLITKGFWQVFRDTYLVEGHPPIFMEFIRNIMANKMSEKEMWGTKEDRMAKGKLIIFDERYLPKEEEKTQGLEVIYRLG